MRALLLQVLYTVRSERLLMEQLDYNFLFRWFVGLSIDDPVWDVTVFTKNRDRHGRRYMRYRGDCRGCALRDHCTKSKTSRVLKRYAGATPIQWTVLGLRLDFLFAESFRS